MRALIGGLVGRRGRSLGVRHDVMPRRVRWTSSLLFALAAWGCGGCASSNVVVLQHPTTEDTVVCPPYEQTMHGDYSGRERCARAWEAKGYARLKVPTRTSFTW